VPIKAPILLGEAGLRVRQDSDEVLLGQRLQFDPDRQAALELGRRSLGLATWKAPLAMKRMWSVFIGPYLVATVVPFDERKEVALDALRG
jgi:hypothetical protein